jgi:hypothetical protein
LRSESSAVHKLADTKAGVWDEKVKVNIRQSHRLYVQLDAECLLENLLGHWVDERFTFSSPHAGKPP